MRCHQLKGVMSYSPSFWIIPFCIVLSTGDLVAQEHDAHPDTLELSTLLETIQENNPDLRASQLEADILSLRRSQIASLPDPQFDFSYQPYPLFTARGSQRTQWRLEQAIPFPGKLSLKGDIEDFGSEIAKYESLTFEQDLLFEAKQAYYELHRIQHHQKVIEAFQKRLNDFEENAATQYVVGTGMQQAILKAQLEGTALLQRQVSLKLMKRSVTETLARLLNTPLGDIETAELEAPIIQLANVDALLKTALLMRPEAKALGVAEERSDAHIALAKKEYLPDFGLNITYFDLGSENIPATATGRDAFGIGFSMNIPIWRGRLKARLAESRIMKGQVKARIEGLDTAFRTQIADLVSQITQEKEQLKLFREALIPQAEITRQATLSAYATGRTGFLDLLDAERTLFSLQTGYGDTFARYMKAVAALERTLGVTSLSEIDKL